MKQRMTYAVIAIGGVIGLVASFLETLEYQALLKNSHAALTCNLNSVFSCSSVLSAWQSKIFGFPNSLLCMTFFTAMLVAGIAGWTGSRLGRRFRLWLHGIALFFLGFAMWFMYESTFSIRALCILCLFCLSGLFLLNWGWLRLNVPDLPIGQKRRKRLEQAQQRGADTFIWLLLAVLVAFVMILRFGIKH